MDDEIKKIIEVIESLERRVNSYWHFYILVVLAIVGWLISSISLFTINQRVTLTIAIALFFIANFSVTIAATKRVVAFESELNSLASGHEFKSARLKNELTCNPLKYRLASSYFLHVIIDLSVLYAIWSKLT